jgi:hypothetical protein
MHKVLGNTLKSSQGSALVISLLVIMSLSILVAGFAMVTNTETSISGLQKTETKAFYIAQTAMDRALQELSADRDWRAGFTSESFDGGTYDVTVFDRTDDSVGTYDPTVPVDYVKIQAWSNVAGVRKGLEALWVDPMTAFKYGYSAGYRLTVNKHGDAHQVITADIHNNSWTGKRALVYEHTTIYGNVTNVGPIEVGLPKDGTPAIIYGDVWADDIKFLTNSEVRKYLNLSEPVEGWDLNGDGDLADSGLNKGMAEVKASGGITSDGTALSDGDADARVDGGGTPVSIGGSPPDHIIDPRPDFREYYDFVTNSEPYPPASNHTISAIPGDGDGHYFATPTAFTAWLTTQPLTQVNCWQCAGDGLIDPSSSTVCPTCGGTGLDDAVEISGVFYIDGGDVNLGKYPQNVMVHGTVVVAKGDPDSWMPKTVFVPGGTYTFDHFPKFGRFQVADENRPHFTQTYRSADGTYQWNTRTVNTGLDTQYIPIKEPTPGNAMRHFPGILAPLQVHSDPAGDNIAYARGDIGDQKLTIMQGIVYSEAEVRLKSGETSGFDDFFSDNGYKWPTLIYHEGLLLGQWLHTCGHYLLRFDKRIAEGESPFGMMFDYGSQDYKGLVAWREIAE